MSSLEKGEEVVKIQETPLKKRKRVRGANAPLTCDVNVSWGGVQRRRRPGSTAVAGSDAFGSGEMLFYLHQDTPSEVMYTKSYILYLAPARGNGP